MLDKLKGRVWAESDLGYQTTFYFTLWEEKAARTRQRKVSAAAV